MEFIIEKDTNKHLIILVHGLNGGADTWKGGEKRFVETLVKDMVIQENFDLALFTYPTKIIQWTGLKKITNTIKGFIANRTKENIDAFNVGIEAASRPFVSYIGSFHDKYDTISIIAHSMGGLITKSALTWINDEAISDKILLFISLSVPHIGANLAKLGKDLLGDNPQILDLQAMGQFTTILSQRYANLKVSPKLVYMWGNQDTVVPEASAIPAGVSGTFMERTEDDHFSIVLIENAKSNVVYRRIVKELKEVMQPNGGIDGGIPQNTPFGFLIQLIASQSKVQVDLGCFTNAELATPLRGGNLRSSEMEDYFEKVGTMAITALPAYEVIRETGTDKYIFKKK